MPKYATEVEKTIMKKFVSSIITITLLLSNQSFTFAEENDRDNYSSNLSAMIQKYDAENYFSTMSVTIGEPNLTIDGETFPIDESGLRNYI